MFSILLSCVSLIVSIWVYQCKREEMKKKQHVEQEDEKVAVTFQQQDEDVKKNLRDDCKESKGNEKGVKLGKTGGGCRGRGRGRGYQMGDNVIVVCENGKSYPMLEYKGYHASINFDAEDKIFVGEVFGMSDSLNFHGTSILEIEEMFHQCIDNYLGLCDKIGKNPEKECVPDFGTKNREENKFE